MPTHTPINYTVHHHRDKQVSAVGLFLGCLLKCPSNMLVYLRERSAPTIDKCCHTEVEVADQTFYLNQSHYTDTRPTSPSADPVTPGAWQGSHWSANFQVTGTTRHGKILSQAGFESQIFRSRGGHLYR